MKEPLIDFSRLFQELTGNESLDELKQLIIWERQVLRSIIDNLPSSVYVKDSEGRKILANKVNYSRAGFNSEKDVIGKTDFEMYPKALAEKFWADDSKVLKEGQTIKDREETVIDADGKQRWQITEKLPIKDDNGTVVGLVGFGHDITAEKTFEMEKIKTAEKMEDQNAMVEKMIAELAEIPTKIGDLVGGIANVSKQTKMLAINAAIEAARVGEHGRGFEIVAREVGELSDKSSEATEQVREAIEEVTGLIQKIIDVWEQVRQN